MNPTFRHGILRCGVAVPDLHPADVTYNTEKIEEKIKEADAAGVTLLAFPELCLTGYTCGDLFGSPLLQERTEEALCLLASAVPAHMLVAVGAPLCIANRLYDCALLLTGGKIVGAVPKTFLSSNGIYAEKRWFSSVSHRGAMPQHTIGGFTFPVGADLLFCGADGTTVGVEIGGDFCAPLPSSTLLSLAGAEVILHLSAACETAGARARRRRLVKERSEHTETAYLYANTGKGESGADLLFAGHCLIADRGRVISENEKTVHADHLLTADLDLSLLRYDRHHRRKLSDCTDPYGVLENAKIIDLPLPLAASDGALLQVDPAPFLPADGQSAATHCLDIFDIQAAALARRLSVTGGKLTVGISGGLDSTLALLVAVRALQNEGLPRTNITAVTMPCFGTSDETLQNAEELMEKLGVTARRISVKAAVLQHFADIGHDPADFSVTFENSQARERTQVLMDVANQTGGIVLGTGDLSELALGWCTYNGDHMSMYAVNAGVPKTLVRQIIKTVADRDLFPAVTPTLHRILDTPISPELLPPDAAGHIAQKTEDVVGPYALHDFFLYYTLRYPCRPAKLHWMATRAFQGTFNSACIKKWLAVFYRRFFSQQFKRNCLPDGIKVIDIGLSPRGDWQMPSDAFASEWLAEIAAL